MGTTRANIQRRIDQLAQRMGVCAEHGCKLRCMHEFQWDGTDEQLFEAADLAFKRSPGAPQIQVTGLACRVCGSALWCEQCVIPSVSPEAEPSLTPDEMARYRELSALMRLKPPPMTLAEFMRQAPTDAPAPPPPAPMPLPEPPVVVVPVVAPVLDIQDDHSIVNPPEVLDEDDEAVDTELASLVEQLKQRLTR